MPSPRQAVVTAAFGPHAELLDRTFTTFAQNPHLELHAFIIGARLPERQCPGVTYHLEAPEPAFSHPARDLYYRRLVFLDSLGVEFALLVDNADVLCMQPLPSLPALLRGAALGACVEHAGSRYLAGQGYTSNYLNAGVTFWNVPASRQMRQEIVARGRARFRSIEDQLTLNEVVNARHLDELVILPCQYNYRALLAPARLRAWPTVTHLDGVKIYHNLWCLDAAKRLIPTRPAAALPDLPPDAGPLTPWRQFWRRVRHRLSPHYVR